MSFTNLAEIYFRKLNGFGQGAPPRAQIRSLSSSKVYYHVTRYPHFWCDNVVGERMLQLMGAGPSSALARVREARARRSRAATADRTQGARGHITIFYLWALASPNMLHRSKLL